MLLAARLSALQGWLDEADVARIEALLLAAHLPVKAPGEMDADRFLELMAVDKKVLDGGLRLVLLRGIGQAVVTSEFDAGLLRRVLEEAAG